MPSDDPVRAGIDALIHEYGDARVFSAFLDTWRPLSTVSQALSLRMIEEQDREKRRALNKVRYARRDMVLAIDDYTCAICGQSYKDAPTKLEVEPIRPGSAGEMPKFSNVALVCRNCRNRGYHAGVLDPEGVRLRRLSAIRSGRFRASYEEFEDEFNREGKVRDKQRFVPDE